MSSPTLGWYITSATRIDGTAHAPDGVASRFDAPFVPFKTGLYASERLTDCLSFARGSLVCRVQIDDVLERWPDKIAMRERTIVWRVDAEKALRTFAHWSAARSSEIACMPTGRPARTAEDRREAARVPGADAPWLLTDASWWAARDAEFAASWGDGPDAAACPAPIAARDAAWYSAWALAHRGAVRENDEDLGRRIWIDERAAQEAELVRLVGRARGS
jgi:hypothetical protein